MPKHIVNMILDRIKSGEITPEKLEKMGARGRQWALEYWTWKNWGNRFKDILEI